MWHYQIRRRVINGEKEFDIVENYDTIGAWTECGVSPIGNTKKELLVDLERMLEDAKKYPVLIQKD